MENDEIRPIQHAMRSVGMYSSFGGGGLVTIEKLSHHFIPPLRNMLVVALFHSADRGHAETNHLGKLWLCKLQQLSDSETSFSDCAGLFKIGVIFVVTETAVTMAAKSNLRNGNPLVLAVSTNDALTGSARNIGSLLNTKNVYFVPMSQDDPVKKAASMVAHFDRLPATVAAALDGRQLQPLYITRVE